jgi:hypothetical protein
MTEGITMADDKKPRNFKLTSAEPDDRVYTRGYRIGGIRPSGHFKDKFLEEWTEEIFEAAAAQFKSD